MQRLYLASLLERVAVEALLSITNLSMDPMPSVANGDTIHSPGHKMVNFSQLSAGVANTDVLRPSYQALALPMITSVNLDAVLSLRKLSRLQTPVMKKQKLSFVVMNFVLQEASP